MTNEEEFFTGVLAGLGDKPTPWRLAVFADWHRHEGMPLGDTWNPIATTRLSKNTPLNLSWNSGFGPGNWNSVPVRVYATPEAGITATVETLLLDYYTNIRHCLHDQTGYQEAVNELATYVGSVAYGQALVNFMNTSTASKQEIDSMDDDQINQLIDARIAQKLRDSQLIDAAQLPELVAQILGVHDDTFTDQSVNSAIRAKLFPPPGEGATPSPASAATLVVKAVKP